jgi:hypothetical protein
MLSNYIKIPKKGQVNILKYIFHICFLKGCRHSKRKEHLLFYAIWRSAWRLIQGQFKGKGKPGSKVSCPDQAIRGQGDKARGDRAIRPS